MKTEFNHAANNSPRSGSTKKVSPVVWAAIVAVAVAGDGLVHDARMMQAPAQPMFERMKAASVAEAVFLLAVQ